MRSSCVMCGSALPADQGSNTCSMCYGDTGHGKDGYYQDWIDNHPGAWGPQHEQQETEDNENN